MGDDTSSRLNNVITIVLKRSWAGEVRNVSLLVAIGVNSDGYREILGICEGAKEDKAGWSAFLKHVKGRGLKGVRLIISARMGLSCLISGTAPLCLLIRRYYETRLSRTKSSRYRALQTH